jgi:hypothetical protein
VIFNHRTAILSRRIFENCEKIKETVFLAFKCIVLQVYSRANMERPRTSIAEVETGRATLKAHELIEDE